MKKEHSYHSWNEVRELVKKKTKLNEHPVLKKRVEQLIEKGEKILEGPNENFKQEEITKIKEDLLDTLAKIKSDPKLRRTA